MKICKRLVTHKELARRCGISPATIRRWVAAGVWPSPVAWTERTWFYRETDVQRFIKTGEWPNSRIA
jgi:predicted site-specific integrase-resolvase